MFAKNITNRFVLAFIFFYMILAILTAGAAALLLNSRLEANDRDFQSDRLLEYWAVYQSGHIPLLRSELRYEQQSSASRFFALRIATNDNATAYIYTPGIWSSSAIERIFQAIPPDEDRIVRVKTGDDNLEIQSITLQDGNRMQILISASERIGVMRLFIHGSLVIILALTIPGVLVSGLLARQIIKPISILGSTMSSMNASRFGSEDIVIPGAGEEVDVLIGEFNDMSRRISQLIRGSRDGLDSIAHDLQTPITRLMHRAEQLSLEPAPKPETVHETAAGILDEARHIHRIIRTVLEISRLENRLLPEPEAVDINELTADMAELYRYSGDPDIAADISFTASESPAMVSIHPDLYRQAVANLLDNAVKYSPPGTPIVVAVTCGDGQCKVRVSDSGQGISQVDIPHIWEKMYRGDGSRSLPGNGLGLPFVKAVIEGFGGSVEVHSQTKHDDSKDPASPDTHGSTFTLILPNITEL